MVASLAAGMAIAMGVLGPQWHGFTGDVGERVVFWGALFVGASFTGAVGLLPLAILITLAETFKIRSLLVNAAAGAVMLAARPITPAACQIPTRNRSTVRRRRSRARRKLPPPPAWCSA